VLQGVAGCCRGLQGVAGYCTKLQYMLHAVILGVTAEGADVHQQSVSSEMRVLQCNAVYGSELLRVVAWCSVCCTQ